MINRKRTKLKNRDIKIICRQMAGMLKSGCDIISTLDTIGYMSTDKVSRAVKRIRGSIEEGKSMTESFSDSGMFPKFFINVLKAGELSGNTEKIFERLAEYYDREDKVKSKILSASIYPLMLFLVSFAAINFIIIFVVGNFKTALDIENMVLPKTTAAIFFLSDFLRKNIIYIYVSITAATYYLVRVIRNDRDIRMWIDKKKFTLPLIGKLTGLIVSEKFSRVLYIMIDGGINITESIYASSKSVNNIYAEKRIRESIRYIEKGNGITDSLKKADIFPPILISMLKSGEESGRFDSSLEDVGRYFREELDIQIEKTLKTLEPALIAVMGLVIGLTMISLVYPMISIISGIE